VQRSAAEGAALLLYGEAGVGKTVLLDVAERAAEQASTPVLRTVGVEVETDLTYAGLHRLLSPLLPQLPRLSTQQRRALETALGLDEGSRPDRLAVSAAVLSVLRLAGGDGALLVIVDDLPWLDRTSAAVLAFIARRLTGTRIGFLGAFRTGDLSYFDGGGLAELEIPPLDRTAAQCLLDERFPGLAPRPRNRLLDEAGGNPLALLELPARAGRRPPEEAPLRHRLQNLFAARVDPLPPATRRMLLLAALDATGDLGVLAAAGDTEQAMDDLAPAEREQLIRIDTDRRQLVFRHPLMRSAVVAMSAPPERRALHAALAAQLTDQPDRRAWHLAEAADKPDESTAVLLEQTAQRIRRRGDAVGAVAALRRAAELSPAGPDRGRRLAQAAYIGAEITGDIGDVPQLLADAGRANGGDAAALAAAIAASAYQLNREGDVDAAYRTTLGAIADRETFDADDHPLVEALWYLIAICTFGGRAELWEPLNDLLKRLRPEPPRYLAVIAKTFGDPAHQAIPVLGELDEMIDLLGREPDPARIARVAIGAAYVDRMRACRGPLQRVLTHGRDGGAVTSQLQVEVIVANDYFHAGQWDEALEMCREGIRLCETHGYPLLRWLFVHQRAAIAAGRGQSDAVRSPIDDMMRWAAPRGVELLLAYGHGVDALLALGQGRYRQAFDHAALVSPPGTLRPYVPSALWIVHDLVESGVRAGRTAEAARHVAAIQDAGIAAISPRLAMVAAGTAGMVAPDGRFADHFENALAVPGAERWPFGLARFQLFYGERLQDARATGDARRHLSAAFDTFQRLGARPWAAYAGSALRATGWAPRSLPQLHAAAQLTPQQRQIAELAAAGLTNKQIAERLFLSPRTVGTHLYQIFPKLGVTSRAALRDALANEPTPEA